MESRCKDNIFNVTKPHILLLLLVSFVISSIIVPEARAQEANGARVKTLVVDPGHGGSDPGTSHGGVKEKDVTLKVAKMFGKMVADNFPDVKVYYTREKDVAVGLGDRGKFANDKKADLFVSIHCNAAADSRNRIITSAKGSLTLVMGMNHDDRNLDVAMRENQAIVYEDNYETKYTNFDPQSPESYIMFSLMQHEHLLRSIEFANILQKHYGTNTSIPNNRVIRRQPLMVLWTSTMPGVLTELGFMTNPEDRSYMNSAKGQEDMSRALFNAFSEYKSKVEGSGKVVFMGDDNEAVSLPAPSGNAAGVATANNDVVFMIQVMASTKKVNTGSANFRDYKPKGVTEKKIGNLYKYYIGSTRSFSEANRLQADCRRKFKDAFVVAFKGEEQVPITDEMKSYR